MEAFGSVGVIGTGAWGTALAAVAARAGRKTMIWGRDADVVDALNKTGENPRYLPGFSVAGLFEATTDRASVAACDLILLVTPAQTVRAVAAEFAPEVPVNRPVVICAKGIDSDGGRLPAEVLEEAMPQAVPAVLSGPSFATDVVRGLPTAVTVAAKDGELADRIAATLSSRTFRPYATTDVVGVEIGGALKNVLAIAAGAVAGKRLGKSAEAALIARGFAELRRFAAMRGARPETLMGLSGFGDLMLSCSTTQSRNYAFGVKLGEGALVADLLAAGQPLAEGALTAGITRDLARADAIDMPVTEMVADIVDGTLEIDDAITRLMQRPLKREEA